MDEHIGESSQTTVGNTAVPEWMLKRRARQETPSTEADSSSGTQTIVNKRANPPATSTTKSMESETTSPGLESEVALDDLPSSPLLIPELEIRTTPVVEEPVIKPQPALPKKKSANPKLVGIQSTAPEYVHWYDDFKARWLSQEALRGYGVSLVSHLAIALLLSLVVFHREVTSAGFNTLMAGGGGEEGGQGGEGLDDSNLLEIDTPVGAPQEKLDTMLSADLVSALGTNALSSTELQPEVGLANGPGSGKGKGTGDGDGEGNGQGEGIGDGLGVGGFKMPEGGKVVRKGSFTAWTVPQDPGPGEDYKIIIQVKYKDKKQKLSVRDISGSVRGTDMFNLVISKYTAEFIQEANQVVVNIPGGAARVRDTIKIYSSILKENQRLDIEF